MRILSVSLLLMFLSACGANLAGKTYYMVQREAAKSRPAHKQFQELCSSPDRSRVYETAKVDGYLFAATSGARCKGGWDVLVKQGYKYYECSTAKVTDTNSINFDEIHRLEIGGKDDNRCVPWSDIASDLLSNNKAREYREKLNGKCFVKSEVNERKSRYAKILEFGYVDEAGKHIFEFPGDRDKKNLIDFSGYNVIDLKKGKSISIDRSYQYWPEGINNKAVGKYICDKDKYVDRSQALIPKP